MIKVKKLQERKNGGRMGVGENTSLPDCEDKYCKSCPKKSQLSSSHCKQQKCNFGEYETETLEKLRSGF